FETAVEAMRRGAADYLAKPFTPEQIRQVLGRLAKTRKLEGRVAELESRISSTVPEADLGTNEPAVQQVVDVALKAAASPATIFLDKIADLHTEIQPKLLRLLQEKEYERVGEAKPRRANVRVIAATNRNLEKAVHEGRFREDLFYRVNVIALHLPPLRERRA